MNSFCIVFVHIGPHLPNYIIDSLVQARLFNSCPIYLILSRSSQDSVQIPTSLNIQCILCEELPTTQYQTIFDKISPLSRSVRNGFWHKTTERFFYLESLAQTLGLSSIYHLENDVLLYRNINEFHNHFRDSNINIAATFDNDVRCIPGFIYFATPKSLTHLIHFFIETIANNTLPTFNDMVLIAAYWRTFGELKITSLPVIPDNFPPTLQSKSGHVTRNPKLYSNRFPAFQSIFDAAAIGQYLGGINPANTSLKNTQGFINESAIYNPKCFEYKWKPHQKYLSIPYALFKGEEIPINNLHIHSKNLRKFRSDLVSPSN